MTEHDQYLHGDVAHEEHEAPWLHIAALLGSIMLVSFLLDHFAGGIPLGFDIPLLDEPATISTLAHHVAATVIAGYIGVLGLKELILERRFSVEALMTLAALGALYLHYHLEAATVLLLYSLAEYFEHYIEDRARRAVEKLSSYMPDVATVIENDSEKTLSVKQASPGMIMIVRPGERIPLDGKVVDGSSYVDQSVVTGESMPLFRKEGDSVYAGTLNTGGLMKVAVTKSSEKTLMSRIVGLVLESRKRKASIERLVDRFARIYVPIVIVLAVFTAFVAPRILSGTTEVWLYRSLIFLVVSCPSAFLVSVPATIFTAITVAAKRGVIVKGGAYIEKLAKVKAVVFDKTGTLTLGKPVVFEASTFADFSENLLCYVAALEQYSNHPMAEAFVKAASEERLDFSKLDIHDLQEIPGKGVVGIVDGTQIAVGNKELMRRFSTNHQEFPDSIHDGHTCVFVSVNNSITSAFCLADDVRSDALRAVEALKGNGIHTAILTGDRRSIAEEIANRLKIDHVYAELLPEDKLRIVDQIRARHGLVAMVGDGVNDAPALAASDVGIAMGGGGVDAALESADVVLVKDELMMIPYVQKLSKTAVEISKQNIVASLGVKLILGALGFLGLVPLWFAVAAGDDGLTMLVLLNTLRLVKINGDDKLRKGSPERHLREDEHNEDFSILCFRRNV